MSKEKELVKNTAIITFGKVCTQLVSFLLLPLYTTALNTADYGTVDVIITYSLLLLPFVTLALEQALFRFLIDVRDSEERTNKYISTTIISSAVILLAVSVVIFGIYLILDNALLIYFDLVLGGSVISAVSLQIMRGLGDNIGYTLASTFSAIVQIIGNIALLVVIPLGPQGMMLASLAGGLSCGALTFLRCKLWRRFSIKGFDKSTFKELTSYSLPLIPNQLSWWALNASDKVIVQFLIGIDGNGLIAVAAKFSSVYINFSNIFNISWTESAALHINDEDAGSFFNKTITSAYKLFLCACCGIVACMPFVFPVMVNAQYNKTYGLIPIFMIASLFNVIVSLYGVIYVAHKKTVEIAKTALYAAILNVVSHLALIHFIGIYAAAVSTAIGYSGMAIYRYFHSRKYMVVKFSNQLLLLSALMITMTFTAYYSRIISLEIVSLIITVLLSYMLNREMIENIWETVKRKSSK